MKASLKNFYEFNPYQYDTIKKSENQDNGERHIIMERYYRAAFSMIPGLGSVRMGKIVEHFGSATIAWNNDLKEVPSLSTQMVQKISFAKREICPESLAAELEKKLIRVLMVEEDEYPKLLKEIYAPPMIIYIKGTLNQISKSIAIVGARKCSTYGKRVTEKISEELAEAGVTVVSGGARGIDTFAHQGALKKGNTVAVLGSGLDVIYPPENRDLFSKIVEKGALISEYPPGTPPLAGNFPARNRLISGFCDGVLVVEAAEKSGSLITANLALEQNRDIFAVPGNIFSETSCGANRLIQQGAKLVLSGRDVLEEIKIFQPQFEKNSRELFTEIEKKVLSILKEDEPMLLEVIGQASELEWSEVSLLIFELEMKGYVKNEGLQGYIRIVAM